MSHDVSAPVEGVAEGPNVLVQSVTTIGQKPVPKVVAGIQRNKTSIGSMNVSGQRAMPGLQRYFPSEDHHQKVRQLLRSELRRPIIRQRGVYNSLIYPTNNSVILDRSQSSIIMNFTQTTYVGHHRPCTYTSGTTQPLSVDLFLDGSLLRSSTIALR